jgi:hypothetical protein
MSIKNIISNKLYKDLQLNLVGKDPNKNTVFFILSENDQDTINLINSDLLNNRFVKELQYNQKYNNDIIKNKIIPNTQESIQFIKDNTQLVGVKNIFPNTYLDNLYIPLNNEINLLYNKKIILTNRKDKVNLLNNIIIQNIKSLNKNYNKINIVISNNFLVKDFDNRILGESLSSLFIDVFNELVANNEFLSKYEYINFIVKDSNTKQGYLIPINKEFYSKEKYFKLAKVSKLISEDQDVGDIDYSYKIDNTEKTFYMIVDKDIDSLTTNKFLYTKKNNYIKDYLEEILNTDIYDQENSFKVNIPRIELEERFNNRIKRIAKIDIDSEFLMKYPEFFTTGIKDNKLVLKNIDDFKFQEDYIKETNDGNLNYYIEDFQIAIKPELDTIVEETINFIYKKLKITENSISLSLDEQKIVNDIYFTLLNLKNDLAKEGITEKELKKNLKENLESNLEVKKLIDDLTSTRIIAFQQIERNNLLIDLHNRQTNATVSIQGKEISLSEKLKEIQDKALLPKEYNYTVLNQEMKTSSANSFRTAYNKKLFEKDLFSIFTSFTDSEDIPIFVDHIDIQDASTPKKRVDLLTVRFIMPNGRPQVMKQQVPKVSADGYLFLNGSKKLISNQILPLPITKVISSGEDVVRFSTNYNKIFISRTNYSLNSFTLGFKNGINSLRKDSLLKSVGYEINLGESTEGNENITSSLEYTELSKYIISIKVKDLNLFFSNIAIVKELERKAIDMNTEIMKVNLKNKFIIGFEGSNILWSDFDGIVYSSNNKGLNFTSINNSLVSLVTDKFILLDSKFKTIFSADKSVSKKLAYSSIRVAGLRMPLIMFLGYKEGIENVLSKYNVEYEFNKDEKSSDKRFTDIVKFNDGYLSYNGKDIYKSLLVNGLKDMTTEDNDFKDFGKEGNAYNDYFRSIGRVRFGKALSNFYSLFLDPITKEILKDHQIPDTLTEAFLYCNTLLQNPSFNKKNDISIYRVRNTELINAVLYKIIAKNIENFRKQGLSQHSTSSLTLPNNTLIKELLESPIVEDVALLNPVREVENLSKTNYKGFGGSPFGHARGSEEVRNYDKSFIGIFGVTTPDNNSVGVTRKLSQNSMIKSIRGYLQTSNSDDMNATNLLSTGELLNSFTATHSDPPRILCEHM